eukprot:1255635-Amphidinium_carterae.1
MVKYNYIFKSTGFPEALERATAIFGRRHCLGHFSRPNGTPVEPDITDKLEARAAGLLALYIDRASDRQRWYGICKTTNGMSVAQMQAAKYT